MLKLEHLSLWERRTLKHVSTLGMQTHQKQEHVSMQACDLVDSQKILIFYFEFTKKTLFSLFSLPDFSF